MPPGRVRLTQAEQKQLEAWKGLGGLEDVLRQPRQPRPAMHVDVDQGTNPCLLLLQALLLLPLKLSSS